MGFSFNIYNSDNVDPDLATGLVRWGPDPISGEYDPTFEWEGRGSHPATLFGRKHQDSGQNIKDKRIRIAGSDFTIDLRDQIQTKYDALDTEFNFTDGEGEVFRVRFSRRPRGYMTILNTPLFATGLLIENPPAAKYRRYSYEIMLWVTSQLV